MLDDEDTRRLENLSNRRRSRELALATLYAYEANRDGGDTWEPLLASIADNDDYGDKVRQYASKLVAAAVKNQDEIDEMISKKAANWELRRMAAVDRNMLRLAAGELAFSDEAVPFKVVIDEAVEIAKTYGTDDSGKFVNGILDSIRKDLQKKT